MAIVRDWTSTLWPASYKGFPFYFDRDDDEFGLGIVVHKFPNRDAPFNEDLGEEPNYFSGSAYVSGDDADARAAAFKAVLVSHGPGMLVVPIYGPVLVRCLTGKRVSEKDRLGFIAFDLRFVREGASSGLISIPFLGNVAATAGASFAAAIGAASAALLSIAGQPEYVAAATADELQAVAAMIDAVRTSYPVAPASSATVARQVQALAAAAPLLLDPVGPATSDVAVLNAAIGAAAPATSASTMSPEDGIRALAGALVTTVSTLCRGLNVPIGRDAAAALIDIYAPETALAISDALSDNAETVAQNVVGVRQLARLAALNAWASALINSIYVDRPQGVAARAQAAERFEIELNHCPGARFAALYVAIETLQGSVVEYLTQLIANLAPVVSVELQLSTPSLVWAWRLYQDPLRAVELVLRNQVRHPSFMPRAFEALAPGYKVPRLPTEWPAPPL